MNPITYLTQHSEIVLYHGLLALSGAVVLGVLLHLLYQRRSSSAIIAWLLSIFMLPYVALPLYLIIGIRKRKNRYKKESILLNSAKKQNSAQNALDKLLRNYSVSDAAPNVCVELFFDASQAYAALMRSIENAQKSICISIYILRYDAIGKSVMDALAKKAKEGVKVRLLMDSLGSLPLYLLQYRLKKLRDSGAEVEFFMPIFEMPFRNYINLRNHRKIYIFDDEKVISGGANISKKYFAAKRSKNEWEDIMFLIEGESVEDFFDIFASDWLYASGKKLEFDAPKEIKKADIYAQIVPSGPDMQRDALYEALLSAIYGAQEKIYITTPYFIPNETLVQALIIAKHRGVDVRLITPKGANHAIINLVRSSYMRELEEAGVKIYLYEKAMLHAKAIIFDEQSVMLGSVNFDNRSLFLNYEVATFIYSSKIIAQMLEWSQMLIDNSSTGTKNASQAKRVFENLLRIFAPQL
ncbi:MAG: cardiolipin synthase [Campylobacterota bacterium]|nr:cardiolipin synthase [Campylobacterota bacterium]